MLVRYISIILLILHANLSFAEFEPDSNIVATVYLIGDAGKDTAAGKALLLLEREIYKDPNSAVIFLGDNIYPDGLIQKEGNCPKCELSEKKLLSQLEIVKNHPGHVYFVPGNHDWNAGKWKGQKVVLDQQNYVEKYLKENAVAVNKNEGTFFPKNGLPGPVSVSLGSNIRLIMVDTQWWLQSQFMHSTPKLDGMNRKETSEKFFKDLDSMLALATRNKERVILAAHHPMFTNGHHSDRMYPWRLLVNYSPLQLFGLIGLNRMFVQDTPQPRYQKMKRRFLNILNKYENVIVAAGHEHNLQYFRHNKNHYMVSGSGSKRTPITKYRYKAYFMNDLQNGFIRLNFFNDGSVQADVLGADKNGIFLSFQVY